MLLKYMYNVAYNYKFKATHRTCSVNAGIQHNDRWTYLQPYFSGGEYCWVGNSLLAVQGNCLW